MSVVGGVECVGGGVDRIINTPDAPTMSPRCPRDHGSVMSPLNLKCGKGAFLFSV